MGTTIGGDSRGLFGRALAPPKTAPALAPLVERLLWWNWSCFEKCLAKQLLVLVSTHGAAWSHVSWLHLSSGSRKGLQVRLLAWSCSKLNCLAGLQLEPVLELILEPCQTCPYFWMFHFASFTWHSTFVIKFYSWPLWLRAMAFFFLPPPSI